MHNFHKLDIWIEGVDLADTIYCITSSFPIEEKYGLSSQMQRAAVSIPSNIAEGSAKDSKIEFARFIGISLGSSFELETQVEIAHRRTYISTPQYYQLCTRIGSLQKRMYSFKQSLQKEPGTRNQEPGTKIK